MKCVNCWIPFCGKTKAYNIDIMVSVSIPYDQQHILIYVDLQMMTFLSHIQKFSYFRTCTNKKREFQMDIIKIYPNGIWCNLMYDNGMQIVLWNHQKSPPWIYVEAIANDRDRFLPSLKVKFIGKHRHSYRLDI